MLNFIIGKKNYPTTLFEKSKYIESSEKQTPLFQEKNKIALKYFIHH